MKKSSLLVVLLFVAVATMAQPVNKQKLAVQQTIPDLFTALSNSDSAGLRLHSTADVNFY